MRAFIGRDFHCLKKQDDLFSADLERRAEGGLRTIDDLRTSRGLQSVSAYGHGPVYIGPCLWVWRRVGTLLLGVQ